MKFTNGYTVASDCEIEMRCHDRNFKDTVFLDESGAEVFAVDTPTLFTSWSMRKQLRDPAGLQVLTMRHNSNVDLEKWVIEDAHGKELCAAKGSKSRINQATTIEAKVSVEGGEDFTIVLQAGDHAGTSTTFKVDGVTIAEMVMVTNNDLSFLGQRGLDRSGWKLKLKDGTDLALVAGLALCRAEVLHTWRR